MGQIQIIRQFLFILSVICFVLLLGISQSVHADVSEELKKAACEDKNEGQECEAGTQGTDDFIRGQCGYPYDRPQLNDADTLRCYDIDDDDFNQSQIACPAQTASPGQSCSFNGQEGRCIKVENKSTSDPNRYLDASKYFCDTNFENNENLNTCSAEGDLCITSEGSNGTCKQESSGSFICEPNEESQESNTPSCTQACGEGKACADPSGGDNPSCVPLSDAEGCESCEGEDRVCVDQEEGFVCTDEFPDGDTNNACGGCPDGEACRQQEDGDPQCEPTTDEEDCRGCPEGQACFQQEGGEPQCETVPSDDSGSGTDSSGPSGPSANPQTITIQNPLEVQSIPELVGVIVRGILGLLGTLALLIIIYGGLRYMTSINNPSEAKQYIQVITNAIIGLVIIVAAFLIVQYIISALLSTS